MLNNICEFTSVLCSDVSTWRQNKVCAGKWVLKRAMVFVTPQPWEGKALIFLLFAVCMQLCAWTRKCGLHFSRFWQNVQAITRIWALWKDLTEVFLWKDFLFTQVPVLLELVKNKTFQVTDQQSLGSSPENTLGCFCYRSCVSVSRGVSRLLENKHFSQHSLHFPWWSTRT